jgi:flagellar biosynthetic protein FliO
MHMKRIVSFGLIVVALYLGLFFTHGFCARERAIPAAGESTYLNNALELEKTGQGPVSDLKLPNIFQIMLRFIISLALIMGMIIGAAFLYKKMVAGKYLFGGDTHEIRILSHRYLDPKKSIYLVDIANKVLIIGASSEQLNLISEITDPEVIAELRTRTDNKNPFYKTQNFKTTLSGFQEDYGSEKKGTYPFSEHVSGGLKSIRSQIEKIKRLLHEK